MANATFPTPPLKKILKAWTYLKRTPASNDATFLETSGGRLAADRRTAANITSTAAAQAILDAHSDTT